MLVPLSADWKIVPAEFAGQLFAGMIPQFPAGKCPGSPVGAASA
jgi:hypothetical protein